ncbi:hypothetical protein QE418_003418 [Microbacterium testaceum]|uniref:DUF3039 domain-containing protein n=1 Tax=Microbacterium TaxID=33882 RepID=UPI00278293D7|nr:MULTISPECIES: DUF3039 domain-containing protein [Microbacterium]MDQ1113970.1 hypothetical protein [Microbacterium testaceum]MDR6098924.1 hypothetical protein [Microbacterium sp. SORGH_AS_0454]
MTMPTMDTDHLEALLGSQDTSKMTQIVDCPDEKENAQAWVDEAKAGGLELTALCGHVWVPESEPVRHPVCQTCLEIAQVRLA